MPKAVIQAASGNGGFVPLLASCRARLVGLFANERMKLTIGLLGLNIDNLGIPARRDRITETITSRRGAKLAADRAAQASACIPAVTSLETDFSVEIIAVRNIAECCAVFVEQRVWIADSFATRGI